MLRMPGKCVRFCPGGTLLNMGNALRRLAIRLHASYKSDFVPLSYFSYFWSSSYMQENLQNARDRESPESGGPQEALNSPIAVVSLVSSVAALKIVRQQFRFDKRETAQTRC
jgi:hypothetical protein